MACYSCLPCLHLVIASLSLCQSVRIDMQINRQFGQVLNSAHEQINVEDIIESGRTRTHRAEDQADIHAALVSQERLPPRLVQGLLSEDVVARTYQAWSWLSKLNPSVVFQDLDKVQSVTLTDKKIGDSGLQKLVLLLKYMTSLVSLDLAGCQIGPQLADKLAPILPRLTNLQRLYISDNNIGAAGTEKLAAAVVRMVNLQMLDLRRNNIGSGGAEKLAMAVVSMPSLQMIDIRQNNIGDDSAQKLVAAVCLVARDDRALKVLWLAENSIADTMQESIEAAVALHTSMPQNCKLIWGQSR